MPQPRRYRGFHFRSVVLWGVVPPGIPVGGAVEPLAWEPRNGTPLLCCVNDRVLARPYLGPRGSGLAGDSVAQLDGLVLDFGLFPALDPRALVLLESSGSPSGYGSRVLTGRELGTLWDVPILFRIRYRI